MRVISSLFAQQAAEDERLRALFINRVELSADGGLCYIFFYSPDGHAVFDALLPHLILYKPSLRAALAHEIRARYTPDILFRFDERFEKQQRIEALLDKVARDEAHAPSSPDQTEPSE